MSNEMKMNVLGLRRWEMTDEDTGEVRSGCTVFVGQDAGESSNANIIGWEIMKLSAPLNVYTDAKLNKLELPSECLVSVSLKLGAGGKGSMQVLGI